MAREEPRRPPRAAKADRSRSSQATEGHKAGPAQKKARANKERKSIPKKQAKSKKTTARKASAASTRQRRTASSDRSSFSDRLNQMVGGMTGDLASAARRLATDVGVAQLRFAKALFLSQSVDPTLAQQAGRYLRDLRELAGLTQVELSEALALADDGSLLKAVENGTATLSFELILRLASVLARHDPIPFVLRLTRTYNPELWKLLEGWGIGRLPLQYERERQFINVYRRHDAARTLSDQGFAKVLGFTRAAFELSLHFIAEQEGQPDREVEVDS